VRLFHGLVACRQQYDAAQAESQGHGPRQRGVQNYRFQRLRGSAYIVRRAIAVFVQVRDPLFYRVQVL